MSFIVPQLPVKAAHHHSRHTLWKGAAVRMREGRGRRSNGRRPRDIIKRAGMEQAPCAPPLASASSCFLCSSVTSSSVTSMAEEVKEAVAKGATLVELRLDALTSGNESIEAWEETLLVLLVACRAASVDAVATLRPTWEGGSYTGAEEERLTVLRKAAEMGAAYIDCELLAAPRLFGSEEEGVWRCPPPTRVILSRHDYERTPPMEELEGWVLEAERLGGDIAKVACMVNDVSENARLLQLVQRAPGRTIALGMGEAGVVTRIIAPKFSAFLTFGALDEGRSSAPGQPTLASLTGLYNFANQKATTRVFGIIGNPVSHSKSPLIHNTAFQEIGVDCVYVPLLVDDLARFLSAFDGADSPTFSGFSVTIPHKEKALQLCDDVDPVAKEIGAVNTIVRGEDGRLHGYNTDWSAAIGAIQKGLEASGRTSLEGKRVVIIGAGGAGRGLAFGAARKAGASVVIANRNFERAEALAAAVGGEAVRMEDIREGKVTGDVLVNTTSVGMHPHEDDSPVDRQCLSSYMLVFDAVYNPMETKLLRESKAAGCHTVSGVEMFIGQAAEQFELFTKCQPPLAVMRKVVLDSLT